MGRLQRIKDTISKAFPSWNSAIFPNRGIPYPLDPFGRGVKRFGRMLGDMLPCFFAENASQLSIPLQQNNRVAVLDDPIPWIETLSMLRFPSTGELLFAQDTFTWDDGKQAVRFINPALRTRPAGETLELFAHPTTFEEYAGMNRVQSGTGASVTKVQANRATIEGLTGLTAQSVGRVLGITGADSPGNNGLFTILAVLTPTSCQVESLTSVAPDANNGSLDWEEGLPIYSISSTQPIYPGDRFWRAYKEYEVVTTSVVGPVPPDLTRYLCTLRGLLPTMANGTYLFLRAYPAYCSPVLPIPEIPFARDTNGPGLLDWISGPVLTDLPVEEVQHLRTYDATLTAVVDDWARIEKNHVELKRPIAADAFLFFKPTQGEINWDSTRWVTKPNADGAFHAFDTCVPALPAGPGAQVQSWQVRIQSSKPGVRLSFHLEPGGPIVNVITDTLEHTYLVPAFAGPVTRVHIAYQADDPTTVVKFSGWTPTSRIVEGVQHVLIARHVGRWEWAASTLLYKPLWLRLEYLRAYLGRRDRLDGGLLVL